MQTLADQRAAEKWADSLAGRPKKALDGALQEEALKHWEALDTERRKREQYLAARVPGLADAPPVAAAPRNAGTTQRKSTSRPPPSWPGSRTT